MPFAKKTWKNRVSEYPTRRKLITVQEPDVFDVQRDEGNILEEGDAFSAATMNDLEERIAQEAQTLEGYFSGDKAKTSLNSEKLGGIAASGYLQTAGGTMTGDLKIKKGVRTDTPIKLYEGDANGNGLVVQAGGRTIIGGGEAAENLRDALIGEGEADTTEKLYLASDTDIILTTNCQTIGSRKTVSIGATGKVTAPGGFSGPLTYSDLISVPGSANLLANPDFTVKSGSSTSTTETGTYLVDRWIFYSSGGSKAAISPGGHMTLTGGTTGTCTLQQAVNPSKFWRSNGGIGIRVTMSCLAKGDFTMRIAPGKYGEASESKVCNSANWQVHTATFVIPENTGQVTFSFYVAKGQEVMIQWAKVNYGSQYATYSPPGTENSIVVPTLLNGWEKMEEGNLSVAKSGNIVTLNCSLSNTSASSSTPFIIPEGYRPEGTIGFFNSDRDLGWIRWWSGEVMLYDKFTEVLLNTSYVATH